MAPDKTPQLALPLQVATPVDVGRLLRELEQIDNLLMQAELRKEQNPKLPKTSLLMDHLIGLNKLDLLQSTHRKQLQAFLVQVREKSPVLHMSFSADPAPVFIERLMTWLRREIDPLVLLTIGLQPNIGAGCIVRSRNKQFDLSLKQDMLDKRDALKQAIALPPQPSPQETPA
jgi:F0F1-type ATP synthase delta subunit